MGKLKKTYVLYIGLISFLLFPLITFSAPATFKDVIIIIVQILTAVLPVIVLLAFIYFLWGLTQYLKADKEKQAEAKSVMINGIIALFVMTCVWVFVWILTGTFIPYNKIHYPDSFSTGTDWSLPDIENPNP